MSETDPGEANGELDRKVVIVGGGPAGCSAGIFTARYGLDTVVFDRGNSALQRCAFLENYPGFPAGIDVDVFHDLLHAHLKEAGGERVPELVESVRRSGERPGFRIETQGGQRVTARYVIAAAWYDGSYLRNLGEEAMYSIQEHHGDTEERFNPDYPHDDGRTPVDGLYVASPSGGRSTQTIVAAGNGAHVARSLIEDLRRESGYTGGVAPHYDWLRPDAEFSGEWADRDRWREWFENELPDDHDLTEAELVELREQYIDAAFATRLDNETVAARSERGLSRLVEELGAERVLEAMDDEVIREYATGRLIHE
ncbi:MAG: FAD-dependent monooxygenase [Actinomycetota bacterium]